MLVFGIINKFYTNCSNTIFAHLGVQQMSTPIPDLTAVTLHQKPCIGWGIICQVVKGSIELPITLYIYLKQYDPAKDGKYDYIIDFRGILTS